MSAPNATEHVISVSSDNVWRWSPSAEKQLEGHTAAVTCLASTPNLPLEVVSGSLDRTVRRWNLMDGRVLATFNHGGPVQGVALRPDGQRVASVSENHSAKLWNINGQQMAELRGDLRRLNRLARLQQQETSDQQRIAVARRQLEAANKEAPLKTEATKKAAETLAAADASLSEAVAALEKADQEKSTAEAAAIEAASQSRRMLLAQQEAETKAAAATEEVKRAEQERGRAGRGRPSRS